MLVTNHNIESLSWDKMDNLIPAIVQHADTGSVLMQGYMNQEALSATLTNQKATFFSRSKQRLWQKGESSGNTLDVVSIVADCDQDSLLILARPHGPTCHLGTDSCFPEQDIADKNFLAYLEQVIHARKNDKPEDSYTAKLLASGTKRCAQKVGEEGVEVALAAATNDRDELLNECADLFYHSLVLLAEQNVDLKEVMKVLQSRHQ
ncbi:bifunctional phosphoribosyl-AMP cyclohydrolase/phosphoribosyl-ATP diphosphatase HisIE [Thalassotalea sp. HSM 43]|uniref:bifunctional phosphoribosyl-AMP cyclohydrolase/phosphoribosyl-ATP diphosphatase HisIE n=1 Tax=Thalassotalea sp. HSM 43 TaxID=2552945 RepID=UPI0010801151|nr:bifunctional phosphoribosyl-AMP cyclohydrolase/phosphoribosyl-ATP diphosphatase HisIE [Thalassotalea sp. HSM 43]QBY03073.1 bifunctional phosphoribosyl-AMP cyclohydrolase/phosphoribosyl-ATP diphosphatase HisIE [Thalassotalea sp. HSM 43]